jgi:sulfate transport system permease protein
MAGLLKRHSVLPGFGLTLGFTLSYLSLLVLLPLAALVLAAARYEPTDMLATLLSRRTLAAFRLTLSASAIAAAADAVLGMIVAWVLVRYQFPGKRLLDALVDLPFALPTAVSGISLAWVYGPQGWIGRYLEALGVQVVRAPLGIGVALVFIGLPFVVRTLQPAIEELDPEVEEAAASLGAGRLQTFLRVLLPMLLPALLTGAALAFARGLGEYGSVVFIAGNIPGQTEVVPLLLVSAIEDSRADGSYDYQAAAVIATAALLVSFVCLLAINLLQYFARRRE